MVLIIGGRAQGKLDYARSHFGVTDYCDGELGQHPAVYNLQNALRDMLTRGQDINSEMDSYLSRFPDAVIICDEVGCGIVPMDKTQRIWREAVGRLCCHLASRATSVHRVFCGIGSVISGEDR